MTTNWGDVGSGALSGAASGAAFGPWGALIGGGIGALGGWLSGSENSGPDPSSYLHGMTSQISPYFTPYSNVGNSQLNPLSQEFGSMASNPGQTLNNIGQFYHQSPGFKFALQQAMYGNNAAAAAGGMAGSPMAQQQAMNTATQMGNQDYYNWLNHAQSMLGQGLQGQMGLAGMGLEANTNIANTIAAQRMAEAQAALERQGMNAAQSGADNSMWSSLIGKMHL